jgi:hypothetical protein
MKVVRSAKPICLMSWLGENSLGYSIRDVIVRGEEKAEVPAVILDNGFMIPVRVCISEAVRGEVEVDEKLYGWQIGDLLYYFDDTHQKDIVVANVRPPLDDDESSGMLFYVDLQITAYLLMDYQIRLYEP